VTRLAGDAVELMMLRSRIGAIPVLWTTAYAALAVPFSLVGRHCRFAAFVEGESVTIACVGRPERFERVLPRVFPGMRLVARQRPRFLWSPRLLSRLKADVVAVELHPWLATPFRKAGWTVVPQNVRWRADLAQIPPARPSQSLRKNLKRVARLDYELELVSPPSAADLREFRDEMVLPLARKRFGSMAWEPSEALFRGWAKRGRLLFVRVDDRRVAGEIILTYGDEAWTPLQGVRGADTRLLKSGVQSVLYSAFFDYARRVGASRVDLGLTTSFVRDGVAYYKRQWGLAPHREMMSPVIALKADLASPAAATALHREPMITLTENGLGLFPGDGAT
jgi:Acetyltransferase (GNAT) domain